MNQQIQILSCDGGATTFPVTKVNGSWFPTGPFKHMDFQYLGLTINNCAGGSAILANGNVLTAEEFAPASNSAIYNNGAGIRDTSDFGGYKRYLNFGWMVEGKASRWEDSRMKPRLSCLTEELYTSLMIIRAAVSLNL
jgi:hypothetical protein